MARQAQQAQHDKDNKGQESALKGLSVEDIQKRILHAIVHKKNVLGSFPISQPLEPLYTVPALTGQFLCLVVAPDRLAIQKHLEQFKRNGLTFPQVAALDGTQPPHLERETLEHVKNKEVTVLYTIPDAFGSIHFLQRLLHLNLACVVVEHAQFLIPGSSMHHRYQRFFSGWNAISKRPPLVLLAPPLPNMLLEKLVSLLSLRMENLDVIDVLPEKSRSIVTVRRCLSEHQKLNQLFKALRGELLELRFPGVEAEWTLPGPTIIHTMDVRTAEKMMRLLNNNQFSSVYTYHGGLSWQECYTIERIFQHEPNTIIVSAYHSGHYLKHPLGHPLRNIFWNIHPGLYEVAGQAFPWREASSWVGNLILYSKEDYKRNLALTCNTQWDDEEMDQEDLDWTMMRLKDEPFPALRRWVLSESCRWASLYHELTDTPPSALAPCGICDRCRTPSFGLVWDSILKHWLY